MDWEPIIIARQKPRESFTFNSVEDVEAFIARETDFWSWLPAQFDTNNGTTNALAQRYNPRSWVKNLRQFIAHWRNEPNARQGSRNAIENALRQRFSEEKFLSALDVEAAGISDLGRSGDPNLAGAALAVIHCVPILSDQNFLTYKNNAYGVAKGLSILAGVDPSIASASANLLNRSLAEFEAQISSLRSLSTALRSDETVAATARNRASDELLQRQDATFGEIEKARQTTFEKLKSDLETLTTTYETKMQLRGPVRYWENKAKRHHRAKWTLGIVLGVYSVLALVYLHWAFDQAAAHLPTNPGDAISYAALFKAGAFALVLTSVAFWIGRVLLRVFLSNQHLATDADERTTMTMTFLALVRSKSIKEEERQLILAPLFKPAADGIVKDDNSPDTAFAAFLSGLIKDKKG